MAGMRQKLAPLVIGLSLIGVISVPVFASTETKQDITTRTQALEEQVTELKAELASMKNEPVTSQHKTTKHGTLHIHHKHAPSRVAEASTGHPADETRLPQISGPTSSASLVGTTAYLPIDLDVPGQSFVSSGPYLGIPLEYSGSNLIINSPSINEDVMLLKMRENINKRLAALGAHHPEDHSHILLSGFIEGQALYQDKGISGSSTTNVDLSTANLDAYILGPSSWTSGLMEFAYDNSNGAVEGSMFTNARTQNSRVFINKAFIILGDFQKSPLYATIGQMYVPFGVYSSTMISSPLTKVIGRTQERAFNLGYQQQTPNALFAAAYFFKGDSHGSASGRINNGGVNLGYRLKQDNFSEVIGAGVIGNIADSQGMQNTGNQTSGLFGGFGATGTCTSTTGLSIPCGNEKIVHRVPAYDVNAKFSIGGAYDFLAEYVTTSTNFNPNDMLINTHGARPQALHGEAVYSFQTFARPTSVSAGYDLTRDALALGLPAKRYTMAVNTSIWRNTLESIEVRHDIDYSGNVTSSGSIIPGPQGTGHSDNMITAQIDLYF